MKAYVIKNKEGKYLGKYSFDNENVISNARVFEFSFTAKDFCPKDCTIVPITIYEGDLEEENRVLKKAFRNLIKEHIEVINEINGFYSLSVEKEEIDEYFDEYIQQAKESEKDE